MTLRALLNKVDRIPEPVLLGVNVVLAGFVLVSHAGALAVTYEDANASPIAAEVRRQAMISLPLTALIVVTGALALLRVSARPFALALHGVVFIAGALYALVYALRVAIWGLPTMPGYVDFVWSVGLMTACVWYAVFLASRYSVPTRARASAAIFYAPVVAIVVALVIDVAVSLRMMHEFDKLFG